MTNEEAVLVLENIRCNPVRRGAIEMAIESLEKQIPKKSTPNKAPLPPYQCCNGCGILEEEKYRIYCGHCGQKLDWSDTE